MSEGFLVTILEHIIISLSSYFIIFKSLVITYNYGNHGHHREWLSDSSQQKEKGLGITFSPTC